MIIVYTVRPSHSGFGTYEKDAEGQTHDGLETVADYVSYVLQENTHIQEVGEGDDGYDEVLDADGKTYGQGDGTIIGWKYDDRWHGSSDRVYLEVVYEVEPEGEGE